MEPSFWIERWENGQTAFHQNRVNEHLKKYWEHLRLEKESLVFVPLCGKSNDMIWLRDAGFRVIGVELSEEAVNQFFAENAMENEKDGIKLLCNDFFRLTPDDLNKVAAVYDRASLIALPPEMRRQYAQTMAQLLKPGAQILLVTFEYDQGFMNGPPFSVEPGEVKELYEKMFEIETLLNSTSLEVPVRFQERGLVEMKESVYRLRRLP